MQKVSSLPAVLSHCGHVRFTGTSCSESLVGLAAPRGVDGGHGAVGEIGGVSKIMSVFDAEESKRVISELIG